MQKRHHPHLAAASPSSSSGGDGSGSGFCLSDIMELDAGSGGDHKAPGTPKSKHSATEQRRRCKINERYFETLYRRVIRREIGLHSFWRSLNMSNSYKRRHKSMKHAPMAIGSKKMQNWYLGMELLKGDLSDVNAEVKQISD